MTCPYYGSQRCGCVGEICEDKVVSATTLCFSQDGTVIHRVGCAMAFGGKPWQTDEPLLVCEQSAAMAGWTPCQYCKPFA